MCGIAGVLSLASPLSETELVTVRAMTNTLRHRGPDDWAVRHGALWAVGNTRLKIIDLSDRANLPMTNEDGSVLVAYNGEITNFRELRAKHRLDERHQFRTTSDTEVLIHLYEDLGIDCLRELTGMFAFCLIDQKRGRAYVVRDFYGIRPLFFLRRGDRLYFASELKALLAIPDFEPRVNPEALHHFFSLAYIPGRLTPFQDLEELQGGELIEVELGRGATERQYYELRYDPDPAITEAEIVRPLHDAMLDSVRRNLISDAPLGLTLSGGFDTSSILALVKELDRHRELHTFSLVIGERSFDESAYQHLIVDAVRPIHHEIPFHAADVEKNLLAHMAYLDEPTGDGAAIPSYVLANTAKKYVSVLLSGEGGDETFNAYETHAALKARALYRRWTTPWMRSWIRRAAHALPCNYSKLSFDFLAKRFTDGAELPVPEAHLFWRHVLTEEEKKRLMPRYADFPPTHRLFTDLFDRLDFADDLNRISALDIKYYFIGDLMVKNDRTFMAHSIEARFPFMDRLLLEFVSRIPPELRLKGLKRRYIQKQAMKSLVPRQIYRRSNMGLELPHAIWFLDEMRPLGESWFARDRVEKTGLFDAAFVDQLWRDHLARRRDNGRALWCVLNVLAWHELFIERRDHASYREAAVTG